MAPHRDAERRLRTLFRHRPVADLATLQRSLGTDSRTTVFRRLSEVGYVTSYSHAGRYYTLADIPRFNEDGLWACGDALFSRDGTLRATVVRMVVGAAAGQTHGELRSRLRLRVHDTLRELTEARELGRTEVERLYLYVSADPASAEAQVAERHRLLAVGPPPATLPAPEVVIEVLLCFIRHAKEDAVALASRLREQGTGITQNQVEAVLSHYAVGKKTLASRCSAG